MSFVSPGVRGLRESERERKRERERDLIFCEKKKTTLKIPVTCLYNTLYPLFLSKLLILVCRQSLLVVNTKSTIKTSLRSSCFHLKLKTVWRKRTVTGKTHLNTSGQCFISDWIKTKNYTREEIEIVGFYFSCGACVSFSQGPYFIINSQGPLMLQDNYQDILTYYKTHKLIWLHILHVASMQW